MREICGSLRRCRAPKLIAANLFAAPYLTVMDWGHDERDYSAGHSGRAPRLGPEAWEGLISNIRAIGELARDGYDVRAVIHPHAGGYIEFEDELDRVAEDVPGEVAGLCLDTGHMDYSGMDPIRLFGATPVAPTTSISRTSTQQNTQTS